ncbi:MAG TPA: hypothetical protein VHE53_02905 [Patescibacteria group bacterium]|nr:hypothetical protein [Patescibacteria group bacterium]
MVEIIYQRQVTPPESITWQTKLSQLEGIQVVGSHSVDGWKSPSAADVITEDAKQTIFEDSIGGLKKFFTSSDLPLPNDDILDRLRILGKEDYLVASVLIKSADPGKSLGVSLTGRLAVVNADKIFEASQEAGTNFGDLMCVVGTHEIVHTLTYQESWRRNVGTVRNIDSHTRRDGIYSSRPPEYIPFDPEIGFPPISPPDTRRDALNYFSEGLVQYVTESSLPERLLPTFKKVDPYAQNLKCIKLFMDRLGDEPFIDAAFNKHGFRHLYLAFEEEYGEGGFNNILKTIRNGNQEEVLSRLVDKGFL